jgi:branched-subunit amino acid transport protein AzlD
MYVLAVIAVAGGVTLLLRAFPFLFFCTKGKAPEIVSYLGRVVSPAAIAMLVVYCFVSYFIKRPPAENFFGAAELAAGAVVVAVHMLKRNPLLSIIVGTALYMVLVQSFMR